MRYGSVCSGIEAATAAWHHMAWEPAFFSEIEAFPRAVLSHHYPEVPLHGDFTTIEKNQYGQIDLLVGGTPCQSFSVAGLRGGLDDQRGNLALEFCRLAQREQPRWIVWENVPGVLSSSGGRDFGSILGALEDLGYGLAYRVLDAQYFGVAQRRRRVFVVGYLGDWRPAAAVLFERHSMSGHPAPSREAQKDAARAALVSTHECGGIGIYGKSDISGPLLRSGADMGNGCEALISGGDGSAVGGPLFVPDVAYSIMPMNSGKDYKARETEVAQPIMAAGPVGGNQGGDFVVTPFDTTQISSPHNYSNPQAGDPCHPLAAGAHPSAIAFAQNTRDEVRLVGGDGQIVGALAAQPGMKQTTYIAYDHPGRFNNIHGGSGEHREVMPTLEATNPKQIIAFSSNMSVPDCQTDGTTPTLKLGGHGGGNPPAVAYPINTQMALRGADTSNTSKEGVGIGNAGDPSFTLQAAHSHAVAYAIQAGALRTNPASGPDGVGVQADHAYTLEARSEVQAVAFQSSQSGVRIGDTHATLDANNGSRRHNGIATTSAVRRLTPVECERLQGFPDNFTAIPWKKKGPEQCPDGPRYKALGNSMAVPVMRWIGKRIQIVDDLISVL